MRLGPLNAESNKQALIESQSHLAWTEVATAPCKIVCDAVGISDVPGTSGIDVKPPNVLLAFLGNVAAMDSGNLAATAFDDDLVRRVGNKNSTVLRGNSTGNAARLACWEATCPATCAPCACARHFDGIQALQQGGLVCLLDNMVCINSVIK